MNSHRPLKALGQHFLYDGGIIRRIINNANLSSGDRVLEIGPGRGNLTKSLADSGASIKAIEIDERLIEGPLQKFSDTSNVSIIHGDAASTCGTDYYKEEQNYALISNLPYNVGTKILRNFLSGQHPPDYSLVMLQKEVARNIVPIEGKGTILSCFLGAFISGNFLFTVKPKSFRPPPKVDSAVVKLDRLKEPLVPAEESGLYFNFVTAVFRSPRKQVHNSLSLGLKVDSPTVRNWLDEVMIDPVRRPGTLGLMELQHLFDLIKTTGTLSEPRTGA